MNDLTAFQNKVTDEDIISVDADTAMAAIADGYNRGLAESNGVATPTANSQPAPTTPAEVGEQQAPIDYEAEYNKIMQPFQASGT